MPTISVVIPAYNGSKTILETLDSLFKQTFTDFEIIVIDDGSTDNMVELLKQISDPRLRVISFTNGGLPVARNRGIDQAQGEFITFIDADDLWTPDKLETQYQALQAYPEAGVVYSWTSFIDENSNFLFAWEPLYYQGDVYADLLQQNFISSGSNIMVRRQYIQAAGYFDPNLKSVEDWDYYLRLAALCPFAVVPKYQILYRRSLQSMTAKVDVMESANLIVIERAFQQAPERLKSLKNRTLAKTYQYLAKQCLVNLDDPKAAHKGRQKLLKAVQFYPKILGDRETIRLIIKLLMVQFLPQQLSRYFIQKLGQNFPLVEVSPEQS